MNTEAETTETPREAILRVAKELGLSMESHFVPFSQSRNKGDKTPSLNWQITLFKGDGTVAGGRAILTTDYMAGSAHCPSYKQKHLSGTYLRDKAVAWECEHGQPARVFAENHIGKLPGAKPIKPDFPDVLYALVSDASVLDSGSFEDWASEYGYDTDSRKAEGTYRACLEIALKLRNGIGEAGLADLQTAAQDY